MFQVVMHDDELCHSLPRTGTVSVKNQAAFRHLESAPLDDAMSSLSVSGDDGGQRRNTRADQFCVLFDEDGSARPLVAVEYKPPYKLTVQQICTDLRSEIHTDADIFSRNEEDFPFRCRHLMAAVIARLFS